MKVGVSRISVGDNPGGAMRANVGASVFANRPCLQVSSWVGGSGRDNSDELRSENCHSPSRAARSTPRSEDHVFTTTHGQHQGSSNGAITQKLSAAWHDAAPMSANSSTFIGAIADTPPVGGKASNANAEVRSRRGVALSIGTQNQWQCVRHVKLGGGRQRRSRRACNDAAFCLSRGTA